MCAPFNNIFKGSSQSPKGPSRPPSPPLPEPEVPIHPYTCFPPVTHSNYPGNISKVIVNCATVTPQDPDYYPDPGPQTDPPGPYDWIPHSVYRQT